MNFEWTGRDDGEGRDYLRIYKLIKPLPIIKANQLNPEVKLELDQVNDLPAIALLGIETDEGVKRNRGRSGAVAGPDYIRSQLANIAVHSPFPLFDAGNLSCEGNDLEALQNKQIQIVSALINAQYFPIILGGGHEIAYGNFIGLYESRSAQEGCNYGTDPQHQISHQHTPKIGIINFDAHFDLRLFDPCKPDPHSVDLHKQATASSGTPFYQIAKYLEQQNAPFHYLCLGISENSNTTALFKTADSLQVQYFFDSQLQQHNFEQVFEVVDNFMAQIDSLYITIDLDVFPYHTAPGVSAPAVMGIPLIVVETILSYLFQHFSNKIKLVDIAEINPNFDIDNHTSKLAAYLVTALTKLRLKFNN